MFDLCLPYSIMVKSKVSEGSIPALVVSPSANHLTSLASVSLTEKLTPASLVRIKCIGHLGRFGLL